jgi:hypothetical protein
MQTGPARNYNWSVRSGLLRVTSRMATIRCETQGLWQLDNAIEPVWV